VQLSTGARVQGHIVQITDNEISVLPKTRIPVPVRHLPLSEIQSIEVQKDGWSPGAKVLTGVGSVAGVLMVVVIAMLANYR